MSPTWKSTLVMRCSLAERRGDAPLVKINAHDLTGSDPLGETERDRAVAAAKVEHAHARSQVRQEKGRLLGGSPPHQQRSEGGVHPSRQSLNNALPLCGVRYPQVRRSLGHCDSSRRHCGKRASSVAPWRRAGITGPCHLSGDENAPGEMARNHDLQ
jgi:hypothetical protein